MKINTHWNNPPNSIITLDSPSETCCICGNPARYIEMNYEVAVCGEECLNRLDEEYFEYISGQDEQDIQPD